MRRFSLFVVAVAFVGMLSLSSQGPPAAGRWDLMILDGAPQSGKLGSLAVGDIDGDGRLELITGGEGAMLWYRPATYEKGRIAEGNFHVGIAVEDIDGDGTKEVVTGRRAGPDPKRETWEICWYKPQRDWNQPWTYGVIDPQTSGGPHDLLFADIDGDGRRDLVATAMYTPTPGLFVYRRTGDPAAPWRKHTVQSSYSAEGTAAGDLDGDGSLELISGPYWYKAPAGGPFAGPWSKYDLAPGFREMCRAALIDVNGDGRLDAVVNESEYPDGRMAWFENHGGTDLASLFSEHPLERPLNFAHTLNAWRDGAGAHIFVAEMAQGGWDAPYNWDARLIRFDFSRDGRTWQRQVLYQGMGTHEATMADLDGDGALEIIGKAWTVPKIQIWKQRQAPSPVAGFRHRFLDREKPYTGTDVIAADVDGDGLQDVLCGAWWYRNPGWERREIPGVYQVLNAHDLDRDGRPEIIATKKSPTAVPGSGWYAGLSSELCWLKPVDPLNNQWQEHAIGTGSGDWPHSTAIAPLLPGGRLALVAGYHSAAKGHFPEMFEIPTKPEAGPWPRRVLAEIPYGEEIVPADLDGDGDLDLAAGRFWLENKGDGSFQPYKVADEGFEAARVVVADINGDGRPDIVLAEERLSYKTRESFFAEVAWFENQGGTFRKHAIDRIRCPHSLAVADLDGDGVAEILAGEHDPFKPYRSRSHLYVYKKAEPGGRAWYRYVLDDRFEHHDGLRLIQLGPGRLGILSHGWAESRYLHLWEPR